MLRSKGLKTCKCLNIERLNLAERGFNEFYKDTFNTLFESLHRYALTIVKSNDVASDAVQSVFVKWWEGQKQFGNREEAKAYLFTAVYRQCLNVIRNEKTRLVHKENYKYEMEVITQSDELELEQLDEQIKSTINDLPSQCRTIFVKSRFESKRYNEIADEMNLSVKTIEAQMSKALKILREKIKGYA
jgi:RNA polymerase sigma-70 factor (ECF subfamily)